MSSIRRLVAYTCIGVALLCAVLLLIVGIGNLADSEWDGLVPLVGGVLIVAGAGWIWRGTRRKSHV